MSSGSSRDACGPSPPQEAGIYSTDLSLIQRTNFGKGDTAAEPRHVECGLRASIHRDDRPSHPLEPGAVPLILAGRCGHDAAVQGSDRCRPVDSGVQEGTDAPEKERRTDAYDGAVGT